MSGYIFGVGVGTFIVLLLVATSILLCFVSHRTQSRVGPWFITFSTIVILLLLSIPRTSDSPPGVPKIEDPLFIPRLCLLALLVFSTIAGFCFLFVDTLMAQTRPTLIRA